MTSPTFLYVITHPLYVITHLGPILAPTQSAPGPLGPRQGSALALDRLQTALRVKTWPHHGPTRPRPDPTRPHLDPVQAHLGVHSQSQNPYNSP